MPDTQDPRSFVHVTTPKTYNPAVVDSWHYVGNRSFFTDQTCADFINFCKKQLPERELPFTFGNTGYLTCDVSMLGQSNAWCLDRVGRIAILLNGTFMFQRYVEGDKLVGTTGRGYNQISHDDLTRFSSMLG